MKKLLLPALTATLLATPALAQSPFSAELLLGNYSHKPEGLSSESDTGFGIRGTFQFHKNFAAEVSYQDAGEADFDGFILIANGTPAKINADISAITLGIKGSYPVTEQFSLNARAGFALWDADMELSSGGSPVLSESEDGTDLYLGFGAEYAFNSNVYTGLAYQYIDADYYEVTGFQLSLGYRF